MNDNSNTSQPVKDNVHLYTDIADPEELRRSGKFPGWFSEYDNPDNYGGLIIHHVARGENLPSDNHDLSDWVAAMQWATRDDKDGFKKWVHDNAAEIIQFVFAREGGLNRNGQVIQHYARGYEGPYQCGKELRHSAMAAGRNFNNISCTPVVLDFWYRGALLFKQKTGHLIRSVETLYVGHCLGFSALATKNRKNYANQSREAKALIDRVFKSF